TGASTMMLSFLRALLIREETQTRRSRVPRTKQGSPRPRLVRKLQLESLEERCLLSYTFYNIGSTQSSYNLAMGVMTPATGSTTLYICGYDTNASPQPTLWTFNTSTKTWSSQWLPDLTTGNASAGICNAVNNSGAEAGWSFRSPASNGKAD